ncbi:MAG: AarF/ABC1/UbiB kinase family protein [Myxococcales bacterium]|nr:AarF/ABC1/UbiB kinase family protein [Myxococcales bacterium]
MSDDEVSGSRFGRLARLGWLSRRAVPLAFSRMRELAGKAEDVVLDAKTAARHALAAEEIFSALGDMKGVALKLGQMLSYMDGVLPEQYRPVYQKALSKLQTAAPPMDWAAVEPVLVAELGGPVADIFAEFAPEPFAAASIGQVHRARLLTGEDVAVKVQYPGVANAMRADLENVGTFEWLLRPLVGLSDFGGDKRYVRAVIDELRARLLEELDYRREAEMQMRFAECFAGDPELRVPKVFPHASSDRVLTTGFIEGRSLAEVCETASQEDRDRYGQALVRGLVTSFHTLSLFNADPHPGNYLFPADGSVVLLDFGCVKIIPPEMLADIEGYQRTAIVATRTDAEADWDAFDQAIVRALKLDPDNRPVYRVYREFILYILRPILRDEPFAFDLEYTRESVDRVMAAKQELLFSKGIIPRMPKLPPLPVDYTMLNRLQFGFFSVLSHLRARVNWHAELPAHIRA